MATLIVNGVGCGINVGYGGNLVLRNSTITPIPAYETSGDLFYTVTGDGIYRRQRESRHLEYNYSWQCTLKHWGLRSWLRHKWLDFSH